MSESDEQVLSVVEFVGKRIDYDTGLRRTRPRSFEVGDDLQSWLQAVRAEQVIVSGRAMVPVLVHVTNTEALRFGNSIASLDTDMRRADAYLASGDMRPHRRPDATVLGAAIGSSIEALLAVGYDTVMSNPVQFAITMNWFWEHGSALLRSIPRAVTPPSTEAQLAAQVSQLFREGVEAVHLEYTEDGEGTKKMSLTAAKGEGIRMVQDRLERGIGEAIEPGQPQVRSESHAPELQRGPLDRLLKRLPAWRPKEIGDGDVPRA